MLSEVGTEGREFFLVSSEGRCWDKEMGNEWREIEHAGVVGDDEIYRVSGRGVSVFEGDGLAWERGTSWNSQKSQRIKDALEPFFESFFTRSLLAQTKSYRNLKDDRK